MYLTHTTDGAGNHWYFINGRRVTKEAWDEAFEKVKDNVRTFTTRKKGLVQTIHISLPQEG